MMETVELSEPSFSPEEQRVIKANTDSYLDLIQRSGPSKFEEIVHEWVWGCRHDRYEKVVFLGGPHDKGRDIAGYKDYKQGIWDGYQCKNYKDKLTPSDIWPEIGKLCYNSFRDEITIPENYFFISPFGVSSAANDLIRNPNKLKEGLISNWDVSCKNHIVHGNTIILGGPLKNYIDDFNFNIFDYIEPLDFIAEYSKTKYFTRRFGILIVSRPAPSPTPVELQEHEAVYIRKILDAYEDHLNTHIDSYKKLTQYPNLKKDFERQRNYFFHAESLKEFSRDISDPKIDNFENLKEEIYDGIIDTIEEDAKNGFERLKNVLARAQSLQITDNPLVSHLKLEDRKGICHHLANEKEEVKWKQ